MDLQAIVMLAVRVSIMCIVFGFGLKTAPGDLLYIVRRPGLLARSLLAILVIMPIFAVMMVMVFDLRQEVRIVLIALSISPVPPLLPHKETKAGGSGSYALGLMEILAVVSIVAVPVLLALLGRLAGRPLGIAPGAIAATVVQMALAPLAAGILVRMIAPAIVERLDRVITLIGVVLLSLSAVALIAATFPALRPAIGDGTLLVMVLFVVVGLMVGHVLGGPEPDQATVLALSTACRHPAIALAIASTNFSEFRFGAYIVLYVLVNAVVAIPYLIRQRRQVGTAVRAA